MPWAINIETEFELSGSKVSISSPLTRTFILLDWAAIPCAGTTENFGFMPIEIFPTPARSLSNEFPDMDTPGSILCPPSPATASTSKNEEESEEISCP
jgi:hypothetical protein